MSKKPIVFEDRKFNSVVENPKIKEEDMPFFKEIVAKTNPDDLGECSEIKIIRREGAKSNTIVVINPNGKVKSLHWWMITKPKPKKVVDEEEINNEIILYENQEIITL